MGTGRMGLAQPTLLQLPCQRLVREVLVPRECIGACSGTLTDTYPLGLLAARVPNAPGVPALKAGLGRVGVEVRILRGVQRNEEPEPRVHPSPVPAPQPRRRAPCLAGVGDSPVRRGSIRRAQPGDGRPVPPLETTAS